MKLNLKNVQPVIVKAAGAIAGNFATRFIPIGNEKVKNAIVAAGGILLSGQKGMIGQLGEGMAIIGVANLAKGFGIGGDSPFILGVGENGTEPFIQGSGDDAPSY